MQFKEHEVPALYEAFKSAGFGKLLEDINKRKADAFKNLKNPENEHDINMYIKGQISILEFVEDTVEKVHAAHKELKEKERRAEEEKKRLEAEKKQ